MKKINWKLRPQNKVTLLAIIGTALVLLYTVLKLCGVKLPVGQKQVMEVAVPAITLLVMLGVVVDPTTPGITDSERAQGYKMLGGK